MAQPARERLHEIHELKREMLIVRRSVWPLREVVGRLERGESPLVRPRRASSCATSTITRSR